MNLPAEAKMEIPGCSRCCGERYLRDIGVVGSAKGWTVLFGGDSGGCPRIGDTAARDIIKRP
ncbi:sulfite reductase, assimilatory-type [hydrocarbon metagenome]|uniref:Sulfite reductase, assimilatory-type n=1 Tax=hydrocarbon metagenome TaxID=938273 RepID=A0A0W8FII6_9ZZZZ|nr:hypothetical protein [Methanomicrobiaceae archaeon]